MIKTDYNAPKKKSKKNLSSNSKTIFFISSLHLCNCSKSSWPQIRRIFESNLFHQMRSFHFTFQKVNALCQSLFSPFPIDWACALNFAHYADKPWLASSVKKWTSFFKDDVLDESFWFEILNRPSVLMSNLDHCLWPFPKFYFIYFPTSWSEHSFRSLRTFAQDQQPPLRTPPLLLFFPPFSALVLLPLRAVSRSCKIVDRPAEWRLDRLSRLEPAKSMQTASRDSDTWLQLNPSFLLTTIKSFNFH